MQPENVRALNDALYTFKASPTAAVDGDTFDATIDLGLAIYRRESVRVAGVNAPELHGPLATPAGKDARDFTALWLRGMESHWQAGVPPTAQLLLLPFVDVLLKSHSYNPREKYGRMLASVVRPDDGSDLAQALMGAGLGVPMKMTTERGNKDR